MNEEVINLQRLSGVAVNRFGITVSAFYQMTPSEFQYALKDYALTVECEYKRYVEGLRFHALQMFRVSGNLKRGTVIDETLIPLSWDKKRSKKQSIQEIKTTMFNVFNSLKSLKRKRKK